MSMMVSFVLSFFPRDVLDEILNLIESVSEDFPSYSYRFPRIHRQLMLIRSVLEKRVCVQKRMRTVVIKS